MKSSDMAVCLPPTTAHGFLILSLLSMRLCGKHLIHFKSSLGLNMAWNRFMPIIPAGIAHVSTEDEVYKGMFIPKGSYVLFNTRCDLCYPYSVISRLPETRAITMNEEMYHDPQKFMPERYLPKPAGFGEPLPAAVFGYGRRYGRHPQIIAHPIWALTTICTEYALVDILR